MSAPKVERLIEEVSAELLETPPQVLNRLTPAQALAWASWALASTAQMWFDVLAEANHVNEDFGALLDPFTQRLGQLGLDLAELTTEIVTLVEPSDTEPEGVQP